MADLYLMEDLKDVAGSLIAGRKMEEGNILELSQLAEKYRAQRLKELCCDFILEYIKTLPKELLAKLYKALPQLGEKTWLEVIKGRPQEEMIVNIASKVQGIDLENPFKKRIDFQPDCHDAYKKNVMSRIEPDMLVMCNKDSQIKGGNIVGKGIIGRVLSVTSEPKSSVTVKWLHGTGILAGDSILIIINILIIGSGIVPNTSIS